MALVPPISEPLTDPRTGRLSLAWHKYFLALSTQANTGGNAITGLTGDVVATGPGVVPAELSDTGVTPGSYGSSTQVPVITVDVDGRVTAASQTPAAGTGDVVGPASATDNAIARFDGTTGKLIQNSGITIADGATGTLAGINSGDVTLAGTPDYITIAGQVITRGLVDLTTDVSGALPIANGGTGQTAQTPAFDALAPTTTTGDLIYYNGTDNVRLGIGSAGEVLTVAAGIPSWEPATGGGGSWIPLVDGAEPPAFITDGAGVLILVAYP